MKNKKGFTLIELLAVITIMGILMIVAIPAVSRTIENSRRSTFLSTAQNYLNSVKTMVSADDLTCGSNTISAAPTGYYYYGFKSDANTGMDLLEQGGKSSWGNAEVIGVIVIHKNVVDELRTKYDYGMAMVDTNNRGFGGTAATGTNQAFSIVYTESQMKKGIVNPKDGENRSKLKREASPKIALVSSKWKYGTTELSTAPTECVVG